MRYQVMAGDSPAGIARKLTGNAGRMGDLLAANPGKQVALSHGTATFASLQIGEVLNVPRSWRQFGGQGLGQVNGYSIGATGATAAAPAFAALQGLDFTQPSSCGPVKAAQQAWNAWGTPQLTVDGGYGPDTASAWSEVDIMTGGSGQVPAGLTSGWPNCGGGGGGGGTYSGAVMAAAAALDAQLAAQGCCGCGQSGSALSNAVAAFKQAILVNPSDWGSNTSASTVTGSTINVSDPACQIAFGSELGGTLADLKAVLGASMTYTGSYCATSNCACVDNGSNCGQQPPPPACTAPQVPDSVTNQCVNPCPGGGAPANGVCPPAPQPSGGSSSSGGALLAGLLLVGGGAVATGYAIKARRRKVA